MSAESPEASPRRHVLLALKITVSIVLLAVLFWRIDVARLWQLAKQASIAWLAIALMIYSINVVVSIWRWRLLLTAQHVHVRPRWLAGSFMVAVFFNNFLPSNIGGDVIRIGDTAKLAGSKTLAAAVVLTDRVLGLMALVFVAALGASMAGSMHPGVLPFWSTWLWAAFGAAVLVSAPAVFAPHGFHRVLQPLKVFHAEWVGDRIQTVTDMLHKFKANPGALANGFAGAVFVQATMVVFYFAVAYALRLTVSFTDLAVIVPISFVIQMLPVSISGFGVREATFSLYFSRIGQPTEGAILMSLVAQVLIMIISLTGAAEYVSRSHHG